MTFIAPAYALTDSYRQTFNNLADGSNVNGSDSWSVVSGDEDDAVIESGTTSGGSGNSLKLVGSLTPVDVSRPASYGSLSPTWVEYVVKPGMGADPRDIPTQGAGAVCFSSTGKILASDGSSWIDTGKTYLTTAWYRVIMKLNFQTHRYDLYIEPTSTPKTPFVADKQELHFIDPSLSSMGQVGFMGAYNMSLQADSRVDEVVVHNVDKLEFTLAPQNIVKGHPSGLMTVQLQNSNSEPQTAWRDIEVELRSSVQSGQFSLDKDAWVPITSVTIPEGAQQVSFYYMDFAEGRPTIFANEYPDRGWTDASQEEKVVSEGDFFIVTLASPQTAGESFVVQIAAMDGYGEINPNYAGTVDIDLQYVYPISGSSVMVPNEVSGFVSGLKEETMAYPDAGTIKIIVRDRDDSLKVGYSGDIVFLPASFSVAANPVQIVGKNFPVTISALEKGGQVARNYQGPARLSSEPLGPPVNIGVFNPSSLPEGVFQQGTITLNTSFDQWGTLGLKVSDEIHPEKSGTSAPVTFIPKAISVSIKPPSPSRGFFYSGENMELSISVLAQNDLPIENFEGTLSLKPTPELTLPSEYLFTTSDKGQKKFMIPTQQPGKYKVKAEDLINSLESETDEVEVKDATIVIQSVSSPVGATTVEIQLVDAQGKRIKEENEMTLTILVSEENDNSSVFFSESGRQLLFKKGLAKLVIGNAEAETVNISARSKYGLKVINGKVVFGKAGSTGVGTLMLRESKE